MNKFIYDQEVFQQLINDGTLCEYCNAPEDCMHSYCEYAWGQYCAAKNLKPKTNLFCYSAADYEWGFGYGDEEGFDS